MEAKLQLVGQLSIDSNFLKFSAAVKKGLSDISESKIEDGLLIFSQIKCCSLESKRLSNKEEKSKTDFKRDGRKKTLKTTKSCELSRVLNKYPNIGKDIEKYVSDRRVGADQWRRTGVLTYTGSKQWAPK